MPGAMSLMEGHFMALVGVVKLLPAGNGLLHREIPAGPQKTVAVKLIPCYAWANRGPSDVMARMDLPRE